MRNYNEGACKANEKFPWQHYNSVLADYNFCCSFLGGLFCHFPTEPYIYDFSFSKCVRDSYDVSASIFYAEYHMQHTSLAQNL